MMSKAALRSKVQKTFKKASDLIPNGTLKRSTTTYDEDTGTTTVVDQSTTCRVMFDQMKTIEEYTSAMVGQTIEAGDKPVYVALANFEPQSGDTLVVTGMADMTVKSVENLMQAEAIFVCVVH